MQIIFKFQFQFKNIFLWEKRRFRLSGRAVDRQSKGLGSYPSAVESVFLSTEKFQILKFKLKLKLRMFLLIFNCVGPNLQLFQYL